MSHELMTPLNAIIGFADVLRMGLLGPVENPDYRTYVRDIHGSAVNLLGIINDILDFSRIENGQADINESACNIEELFDSVSRLIQDRLQAQGLALTLDLPARLPRVHADKRKLKQILFNLLSNAFKFTPDGGSVRVEVKRISCPTDQSDRTDRSDFVEISVTDSGIGIRADDIEKLFTPFTQLESAYCKSFQGTGLGLALTRKLVELHGGRIWVTSDFGQGSRFAFVIPVS
jgi:signal transduction histidine kinase